MEVAPILTPYFLDQRLPGLDHLAEPGWYVNRPELPEGGVQRRMSVLYGKLAAQTAAAVEANRLPVSLAGDCCTAIGVLGGLQRAGIQPRLLWFDAHGDFNTWETTPSGFLGGMPLAMLVGRGEQTLMAANQVDPLEEEKVILTDGRDLDPEEGEAVAASGLQHLRDPRDLLQSPLPPGPLWVHFDTDIVDPEEVPAMNYPAPGGPGAEEMKKIFQVLADSGRLRAVSLSSWAPDLDHDGRSERVCLELLSVLTRKNFSTGEPGTGESQA